MMDMSSDLVGSGIPFLDYRTYAERIFFPGHQESPVRRDLDVPACRRATVEQGLVQLSNLLNSKLFLIKVTSPIHKQPTGPWTREGNEQCYMNAECVECCSFSSSHHCSSSTLSRARGRSRPETERTWPLSSRWRCMESWSISQTSLKPC